MFRAPPDVVFKASVVDINGSITPLTENTGSPAPPDAGLFSIVDQNKNSNPAIWTMYVRPPAIFTTPLNYSINVVQVGRGSSPVSAPMVVRLVGRPVYTVHVEVSGDGRVTSSPGGITCRQSSSPCDYDFGQSIELSLNPNSGQDARFVGFTGNCRGRQVCTLTLNGDPASVVALFEPSTGSTTIPTCPVASGIAGMR